MNKHSRRIGSYPRISREEIFLENPVGFQRPPWALFVKEMAMKRIYGIVRPHEWKTSSVPAVQKHQRIQTANEHTN